MNPPSTLIAFVPFFAAVFAAGAENPPPPYPKRIVSLAPNTTEILFGLSLGDKVVGATRFCNAPAAAAAIPRVGGLLDPDYEAIVSLEPDLAILLDSQRDIRRKLEDLGIQTLVTPHRTLGDIRTSTRRIGDACGVRTAADQLLADMDRRLDAVRHAVQGRRHPRVMVCFGRDFDASRFSGFHVACRRGFHNEIIEAAGGVNVIAEEKVDYIQIAAEAVLRLDPEVIIELVSELKPGGKKEDEIARQWDVLAPVAAVRDHRVRVIVGDHAIRPVPRTVKFVEDLARILHPAAFAEAPRRG